MEQKTAQGPAAPKDPEKKRSSFYIMRKKQVAGTLQPDGSGIQYIYLDNERLVSFAKIAGSVSSEEIFTLLRTAEGFRKLVYAIGVTVETENPSEDVGFVLQMYGKTDPYATGTSWQMQLKGDGMEQLLKLSEQDWSEENDVPGQIRFLFAKADTIAAVSVRLYLQEGFSVPEPQPEEPADLSGAVYQKMLEKSLLYSGNNSRLKGVLEKARAGEKTTIAFLGGSITQGAGAIPINRECYAWKTFQGICALCGRGTEENLHYVKAGVGGTSSELGVVRYERDVCRDGKTEPDLVVVEFAVNDEGDETKGECFESLLQKIAESPQKPAIILLFSVFSNDWNLQERLSKVGYRYKLPMVSIKDCVTEQFYRKPGEGRVCSKNQFFYDIFHPNNLGHTVMADCLLYAVRKLDAQPAELAGKETAENEITAPSPVYSTAFSQVKLLDRSNLTEKHPREYSIDCGDFSETDRELQEVERDRDSFRTPEFPYNWMHRSGSRPFCMELSCRSLFLVEKDSASIQSGKAEIYVDGKKMRVVDPREVGWVHCNALLIFQETESRRHRIEVRMAAGEEEKQFTILGFGYVV